MTADAGNTMQTIANKAIAKRSSAVHPLLAGDRQPLHQPHARAIEVDLIHKV